MSPWDALREQVVEADLCCGCGACAGGCPDDALEMSFNRHGEYVPHRTQDCRSCGLCLKVCPFINSNPNEDELGHAHFGEIEGVQHRVETGYYLSAHLGHAPDPDVRWNGSSGGMATWVLCELLERDEIDHVLTVTPRRDPDKLFEFCVASSPDEVRRCSKSSYYPVEASEVLRFVRENEGRYAFVGLPCACKAIRLVQRGNQTIGRRLRWVFGLVCGMQQACTCFVSEVARIAGLPGTPVTVCFRDKSRDRPASNFGITLEDASGNSRTVPFRKGPNRLWGRGIFSLGACKYCDDIFSECADAAFMDAWLPEYSNDPEGHSIVLSRSPRLDRLLDGVPTLKRVGIEEVVRSQSLEQKREKLRVRLFLSKGRTHFPRKRVKPRALGPQKLLEAWMMMGLCREARRNLANGLRYNTPRFASIPYRMLDTAGTLVRRLKETLTGQ